jgi:hypothetical protein
MKFFDLRHPFFLPLWRRIATVAFTGLWAGVEFVMGSPGWAVMFGAIAAYCAYMFFIAFDPSEYEQPRK